jgi:hypothetical protein
MITGNVSSEHSNKCVEASKEILKSNPISVSDLSDIGIINLEPK